MWHLETQFRGGLGIVMLTIKFYDLKCLFQHKGFYDFKSSISGRSDYTKLFEIFNWILYFREYTVLKAQC